MGEHHDHHDQSSLAAHGTLSAPEAATQSVVYKPRPGYAGADSFQFRGANPGGAGTTRTATLKVGKDTIRPRLKRFVISSSRVSVSGASASRKTNFKLRYSETATATITIERRRDCAHAKGGGKRCRRFRKLGTLRARRAALSAKVPLRRRIGGKRLSPGRYRARAVARDLAGNRSKPRRLGFTVVSH